MMWGGSIHAKRTSRIRNLLKRKGRRKLPGDEMEGRFWCLTIVKRGWSVDDKENVVFKPGNGRNFEVSSGSTLERVATYRGHPCPHLVAGEFLLYLLPLESSDKRFRLPVQQPAVCLLCSRKRS